MNTPSSINKLKNKACYRYMNIIEYRHRGPFIVGVKEALDIYLPYNF